jgi:HSP20 family protein
MKKIFFSSFLALLLGTSVLSADKTTQPQPLNPFEEIQKIQQEMDQIFNRLHQRFLNDTTFSGFHDSFTKNPAADIVDKKDHYLIKANIPGADDKSIKVTTKDNILKIEANTVKEEKEEKDNYIRQERFVGQFVKILTLPKDANADKLKTSYKNGVLTITIPKKAK